MEGDEEVELSTSQGATAPTPNFLRIAEGIFIRLRRENFEHFAPKDMDILCFAPNISLASSAIGDMVFGMKK
jgi:hypothetical protein